MKNGILFIGQEFVINESFIHYIKREFLRKVGFLDTTLFLHDKNKDIFLIISQAFKEYDNLLIVTSIQNYPTVSKIVATLCDDILIAKEDMLAPSKAKVIKENSFLIEENGHFINVLRAKSCQKLPQIELFSDQESVNLYTFNLDSASIEKHLVPLAQSYEVTLYRTCITPGLFKITAYSLPYGNLSTFVQKIKELFSQHIIITPNIFEYLIERLSSFNRTITFAESCTGGLLASLLTQIPGSSNVFKGSMVTYSNELKHQWLGVSHKTLEQFGAVSQETVKEMLSGILMQTEANYAIAISGIAGPGGATPTKPVGTVVIGCSNGKDRYITTKYFKGDRNYIQYQAAMYGIRMLFELEREILF